MNFKDRVKVLCTFSGVGNVLLGGTMTGTQSFDDGECDYSIENTAIWEIGRGTVTGNVLVRDTVFSNSQGTTNQLDFGTSPGEASLIVSADTFDGFLANGGQVDSVVAGTNVTVNSTDPASPIVSVAQSLFDDKEDSFTKNTAFNKDFGTAINTVTQGNDARLSDARTPTVHNHTESDISDLDKYTQLQTDNLLNAKEDTSNKGIANGYASLDATTKIPLSQIPDSVLGQVEYQGVWNATTNTPTIPASGVSNKGDYYKVSVAGSTPIDGESDWQVGDWIISNGAAWDKIDNTDQVVSVAGKQGIVTLDHTTDLSNVGSKSHAQIDTHIAGSAEKHNASVIINTPSGNIAATDVQAALNELDTEKLTAVSIEPKDLQGDGTLGTPLAFSEDVGDMLDFFVGATLHAVQGNITSDGVTVTAQVENFGGGDIKYITDGGVVTLDTTPATTVVLTPGTDTVPVVNYMFINTSTNLFEANITGFPAGEYVPLAITYIGSASFVQADGTYKTHKWGDDLHDIGSNGHLSHINKWIRAQHATWVSGNALSHSGSGTATVNLAVSSGVMFQLHKHATEAKLTPSDFYVPNDETTPFLKLVNLTSILTDSTGASINNKYTPLVVWYAYSELPGDSKVFINKPSGTYSSESGARADTLKFADFSIPSEFLGTAILLHRLVVRNSGGTVTIFDGAGDDLRGTLPNTASGSSTSVGSTFLDNLFRVENNLDITKQIAFDASVITTGNIRTITMADTDIDLADVALISGKEDALGNPLVDGHVLSSTIAGVRSWVDGGSGGGGGGTLATLDTSMVVNEQVGLTLSSAQDRAGVFVTKEIPQTGIENGNWDALTAHESFFGSEDSAYAVGLTPSANTGDITLTLASGTWGSGDVGKVVTGNNGVAVINGTSGSAGIDAKVLTNFANTSLIASGDWVMTDILLNGVGLGLAGFSVGSPFDITTDNGFADAFEYLGNTFSTATEEATWNVVGVLFTHSGERAYFTFYSGKVARYDMSTPYDLTTMVVNGTANDLGNNVNGSIVFNEDGTKVYMLNALSTLGIREYSLSTPYDIHSEGSSTTSYPTNWVVRAPISMDLLDGGTKLFIGYKDASNNSCMSMYTLSVPYDLTTTSVSPVTQALDSAGNPYGMSISNDGTRAYSVSLSTDVVGFFGFSTPYDITTSVSLGTQSVSSQSGLMYTIKVTDNGKLWLSNNSTTTYEYELLPGFDKTSTITLPGTRENALFFKPDGLKMYIMEQTLETIHQYSLSIAWDITTLSDDGVSIDASLRDANPISISFTPDGLSFLLGGLTNDNIFVYDLSVAWDLSTAIYSGTFLDVSSETSRPQGLLFGDDGFTLWVSGSANQPYQTYKYILSTAYDVTTGTYDSTVDTSSIAAYIQTINFNGNGTKAFFRDTYDLYEADLSIAYDLSSFTLTGVTRSFAGLPAGYLRSSYMSADGKHYFVSGDGNVYDINIESAVAFYYNADFAVAHTSDVGQIDTEFWTDLNSLTVTEELYGETINYAISTDDRITWQIAKNIVGSRSIVRNNAGTWEYNSNATYASTTWTVATTNTMYGALRQSMSVAANVASGTALSSATDTDLPATGNTLDIACILKTETTVTPFAQQVSINYDGNVLNQGALIGIDYNYDQPDTTTVRISALKSGNYKIRVM